MRIFLVGFMGSGKTTVGKKIAKLFNYSFIDLDEFIEKEQHKSISELFNEFGEDEFRNIEHKALLKICGEENIVVSTGGGTPCFNNNMETINKSGLSIYLKMSASTLLNRLSSSKELSKRPLIKMKSKEELEEFIETSLETRDKYYSLTHFKVKAKDIDVKLLFDFINKEIELLKSVK